LEARIASLEVSATTEITCNVCGGSGELECRTCGGTGEGRGIFEDYKTCRDCFGDGKRECRHCKGTGRLEAEAPKTTAAAPKLTPALKRALETVNSPDRAYSWAGGLYGKFRKENEIEGTWQIMYSQTRSNTFRKLLHLGYIERRVEDSMVLYRITDAGR